MEEIKDVKPFNPCLESRKEERAYYNFYYPYRFRVKQICFCSPLYDLQKWRSLASTVKLFIPSLKLTSTVEYLQIKAQGMLQVFLMGNHILFNYVLLSLNAEVVGYRTIACSVVYHFLSCLLQ